MHQRLVRYAPFLVLGAAFLMRLAHVMQVDASPLFAWPVVDGKEYVADAAAFLGGNWLGVGQGPYWHAPLYSWFLGLTAGVSGNSFFYTARVIQCALGAVTCWFAFDLGRRLFRVEIGLIAGLVAAFYGPLIYFDAEILPTSLAIFLDMAGLYLITRALQEPKPIRFLGAGVVFGLATLAVATILTFVAAAAAWIAWVARKEGGAWRPALVHSGIFAAGVALVIAPVTLRNYAVGGDTVLVSWNGGVNYYIGNNADYEDIVSIRAGWEWTDFVMRPDRAGITRPSEKSSFFFNEAKQYIASDPLGWAGLQLRKTAEFWRGDEIGRNQPVYYWRTYSPVLAATMWKQGLAFPFGLLAPFALLGIALSLRRPEARLPLLFTLVYSTSVIAFFPAARYRLPVVPVLAVFAAWGGVWLYQAIREKRPRATAAGFGALAALVIAASAGVPPMDMEGEAEVHFDLGDAYLRAGALAPAQAAFTRALESDPTYWEARFNIGTIRGMMGDNTGAVSILQDVSEAEPDRAEVWLNLAAAHLALTEMMPARIAFERVLSIDPKHEDAYIQLLALSVRQDDSTAAQELLARVEVNLPEKVDLFRDLYDQLIARQEQSQTP